MVLACRVWVCNEVENKSFDSILHFFQRILGRLLVLGFGFAISVRRGLFLVVLGLFDLLPLLATLCFLRTLALAILFFLLFLFLVFVQLVLFLKLGHKCFVSDSRKVNRFLAIFVLELACGRPVVNE